MGQSNYLWCSSMPFSSYGFRCSLSCAASWLFLNFMHLYGIKKLHFTMLMIHICVWFCSLFGKWHVMVVLLAMALLVCWLLPWQKFVSLLFLLYEMLFFLQFLTFDAYMIGVLEANFIEPAHDKQDFERSSLFIRLEARMKQMVLDYWFVFLSLLFLFWMDLSVVLWRLLLACGIRILGVFP